MKKLRWYLAGIFTVISLGTVSAMYVGGELESALLEKLSSDPTGNEAQVYYNTTTKKARLYNGTAWAALGSGGAGEINYNDDADGTGNWTELGDGITVSTTTTEAEVPRWPIKTQAVLLTNDTTGTSGFSVCVEVGEADRNKKLKIEWAQIVSSSPAYASGEFTYQLFSETNDTCTGTETGITLHSSGDTSAVDIPAQNGVMYDEFDATDAQYYELKFVRASGASASTVGINDLVIGPGKLYSGAVVTAWRTSSTPSTFSNAIQTYTQTEFWRRVGDSIEVQGELGSVDAGSAGAILITSGPEGYTFDTSYQEDYPVGIVQANEGINQYITGIIAFGSSGLALYTTNDDADIVTTANSQWTDALPFAWASDFLRYNYKIPISEWSGSGVLNTIVQDNLTEWQTEDAEDFLNNTGGGFDAGSMRWRQVGDSMEIHLKERSNLATGSGNFLLTIPGGYTMPSGDTQFTEGAGWYFDNSLSDMQPMWAAYDSSTTIRFNFQTAAGGFDILDWTIFDDDDVISAKIRVPIVEFAGSQSSVVGFSRASETQQGLVSRQKEWSTTGVALTGGAESDMTADLELVRVGNNCTLYVQLNGGANADGAATDSGWASATIPSWGRPLNTYYAGPFIEDFTGPHYWWVFLSTDGGSTLTYRDLATGTRQDWDNFNTIDGHTSYVCEN